MAFSPFFLHITGISPVFSVQKSLLTEAGKLRAQKLIASVRASGRSLLTEAESKLLLKARQRLGGLVGYINDMIVIIK